MLKHEDHSASQPETAAQVRVTAEELAAAVTALQIRKEGQPGTIAIGEAVEELELDVTPEEVLAEVEAGRAHKRKKPATRAQRRVLALGVFGILLGLTLGGSELLLLRSGPEMQAGASFQYQPQSGPWISGTSPYNLEPSVLALNPGGSHASVSTLAEVPEGKTVYCSPDAIDAEAISRATQWAPRHFSNETMDMNWPVVKHGKELYLRGWIRLPLSPAAAKLSDVEVFNRSDFPQLGTQPQQVTFKVGSNLFGDGIAYQRLNTEGGAEFFLHNPRLTVHTYEKW